MLPADVGMPLLIVAQTPAPRQSQNPQKNTRLFAVLAKTGLFAEKYAALLANLPGDAIIKAEGHLPTDGRPLSLGQKVTVAAGTETVTFSCCPHLCLQNRTAR
ncbi:MAG: hypothetical protein ACI4LE_05200, partial [Faecalibacterium sp.]